MRSRSGTSSRVINLVALAVSAALSGLPAFAMETHRFDIPEETASAAIRDFGAQAHVQVLVAGEYVKNKKLHAVSGNLSTDQALDTMLEGSGLTHKYVGDGSIALIPVSLTSGEPRTSGNAQPGEPGKGGQDSFGTFLLAQAAQGQTSSATPVTSTTLEPAGPPIQEVIVTAQKKAERLQDVPVPVSAIDTQVLAETNQIDMKDYFSSVPSLNVTTGIIGEQTLTIRGIGGGGGPAPTVGVTVDDVPFGGSTAPSGASFLPDIDPGDLARIEVLRGPQGTLYGANSMGGLVKFVTVDPSTTEFSGRVEAGTSAVFNGAEPGYSLRASANIPLGDTFAVRMSGFDRQDPGYIDNPGNCAGDRCAPANGVNKVEAAGGRLSALWQPSELFSLKLSAMYQHFKADSNNDVVIAAGLGDLQQNYIPGAAAYDRKIQAYSAVLKAKLGNVDIVSVTGYNQNRTEASLDFSAVYGSLVQGVPGFGGVTGAPYSEVDNPSKISQELRASVPLTDHLDWLLGGFYSHEHDPLTATIDAEDTVTGQITGQYYGFYYLQPVTYTEYAGFTDLTYRFNDRFDVQVGARETEVRLFEGAYATTGPIVPAFYGQPSPLITPSQETTGNAFTYLLTPRLKINSDLMIYARLASGFRPGSPNSVGPAIPPSSKPDKTQNYEIGLKGDFEDHRVSVDASVYYIKFQNIQLLALLPDDQGYFTNGSGARSDGLELSVETKPISGLTVGAWVDYDDAVLTQDFPTNAALYGVAGNRLPYTSRLSGSLSFEEDFPLSSRANGFFAGTFSYVGDRLGDFNSPPPAVPPRQDYPGYVKTDLRLGVKAESWTVNAFVTNLADKRGLVGGGLLYTPPNAWVYITPRTIGVNVVKTF